MPGSNQLQVVSQFSNHDHAVYADGISSREIQSAPEIQEAKMIHEEKEDGERDVRPKQSAPANHRDRQSEYKDDREVLVVVEESTVPRQAY